MTARVLKEIICASGIISKGRSCKLWHRGFNTSVAHLKEYPQNLKGQKSSSQQWLKRQFADPYVKKARLQSYRCRSAFKLLEIENKHELFKPGMTVIDCGASPGSWSQIAVRKVNALGEDDSSDKGQVISIDLQYMMELPGATVFSQMDFTKNSTQKQVLDVLQGRLADVILSDMAPNATGMKSMDHENIVNLCMAVLKFARVVLKDSGTLLCKIWQGREEGTLIKHLESHFETVKIVKPSASRADSAEIFLLGKNFRK